MAEQIPLPEGERTVSRRDFVRRLAGTTFTVMAGRQLAEGVTLRERPLYTQKKTIVDMELLTANVAGLEGSLFRSGNELLFDPLGDFFVPGQEFVYVHRTNRPGSIAAAYELGATMFDIDVNSFQDELYADHGKVPQLELKLGSWVMRPYLPAVIDVDEMGFKIGKPRHKYKTAVARVRDLSNEANQPLTVAAELKRVEDYRNTLSRMLLIHQELGIPLKVHSEDYENLMHVGEEIALASRPT